MISRTLTSAINFLNRYVDPKYKDVKLEPESVKETARFHVTKYASQEDFENGIVMEKSSFGPNILLNAGITAMLTNVHLAGGTQYNAANSYLGVGDSSVAEVATQTTLQAATNKLFKAMDATYPQVSGQTVTFQSTFGGTEANFAWNEFGVANSAAGTVLLNRKVSGQGQKISGQIWVLTLTITYS